MRIGSTYAPSRYGALGYRLPFWPRVILHQFCASWLGLESRAELCASYHATCELRKWILTRYSSLDIQDDFRGGFQDAVSGARKLSLPHVRCCEAAGKSVTFVIKNTGTRPGAEASACMLVNVGIVQLEVAQLYLEFPPSAGEPFQLKGGTPSCSTLSEHVVDEGCGHGKTAKTSVFTSLSEALPRPKCRWIDCHHDGVYACINVERACRHE